MKVGDKFPITIDLPFGVKVASVAVAVQVRDDGACTLVVPNAHINIEEGKVVPELSMKEGLVIQGTIASGSIYITEPLKAVK